MQRFSALLNALILPLNAYMYPSTPLLSFAHSLFQAIYYQARSIDFLMKSRKQYPVTKSHKTRAFLISNIPHSPHILKKYVK